MKTRIVGVFALNVLIFLVLLVASHQILFSVHAWAWPRIHGPNVTVSSATGYAMGGPLLWAALGAIPASFIPKVQRIPGRYFLALGVLLLLFSTINAYRAYSLV